MHEAAAGIVAATRRERQQDCNEGSHRLGDVDMANTVGRRRG